jgi:hypothetical protein
MPEPSAPQRVSPVVFPRTWDLPARPEAGPALDAYRQSEFVLRSDLRLLQEGMNLQLRVVADTYPFKYRTHAAAAAQLYWSRVYHCLSDAALLLLRGSYAGVPALVRGACECQAASAQISGEELPLFLQFLAATLHPHAVLPATDVGMGGYHAGGTLARNDRLGFIYRVAAELARPNIGPTLLLVAPESSLQKLAVTFADQSFHLGWAQLELGWLVELCALVLENAVGRGDIFGTTKETGTAIVEFISRAQRALGPTDRCSMSEIDEGGERRFLITNFRRQAGGAPRKIVL